MFVFTLTNKIKNSDTIEICDKYVILVWFLIDAHVNSLHTTP